LEAEIESHVADALKRFGVECVVLAGYMRVVKNPLLQAFPGRILNMHPSLLPQFPGKDAWKQALDAGVTVTGCSVHVVDDGVDTGTVLAQRRVPVLPGDTPDRLHARIQEAEHVLYPEVLNRWAGRIRAGTTGGAEPRGPE
jgi:phosphoribosylglycinamide formyltransferase-1